jgi:hypothetical protein
MHRGFFAWKRTVVITAVLFLFMGEAFLPQALFEIYYY